MLPSFPGRSRPEVNALKRIQRKDAVRNIRRKIVSWLSIVTIMMLGEAGLLGLSSSAYAMKCHILDYLERYNYKDFDITSSVGVSEEDIENILAVEGVVDAEGVIEIRSNITHGDDSVELTVYSGTERISATLLSDGKMPKEPYECALCMDLMEDMEISLGDTVTIKPASDDQSYVIRSGDYIVTGVVDHPDSVTRYINNYAMFPDSAINAAGLGNDYTNAFVDVYVPDHVNQLEDEYYEATVPVEDRITEIFGRLTELENSRIEDFKEEHKDDEELPDFPEVRWMIMDRNVSQSFLELSSSYETLERISYYFAPLFALIAFMVCFSTITILVEEQKSEIGTQKALGMRNGQVRAKYMTFGISAAFTGVVAGIFGSFGMEQIICGSMGDMFLFGSIPLRLQWEEAAIMSVVFVAFASIVVFFSCNNLIKCSAVGLMNGSEPAKRGKKHLRSTGYKGAGIYLWLIISNIRSDFERVIVSVVIVMESVLMIGTGITLQHGLVGALYHQVLDIWEYSMIIEADGEEDTSAAIEKRLAEKNLEYLLVHKENAIMETPGNKGKIGVQMLSVDDGDIDRFGDYFRLEDEDGGIIKIPESGMLITEEMREKDLMETGDEKLIVDQKLETGTGKVSGAFHNHLGKYLIFSDSGFEESFGYRPEKNCYLVLVDDEDETTSTEDFEDIDGIVSVSWSAEALYDYEQVILLYDLVVAVIILMVIMLAFMIQLNLSNIQVSRRMRELLIMRVNGFSMWQVTGYLARETILVTGIGIALGIALGVPFAGVVIRQVEVSQFVFERAPYAAAWVVSGLLCALFSVVINAIAYRRIRKVPISDISRY